jgi:hypothetical protein
VSVLGQVYPVPTPTCPTCGHHVTVSRTDEGCSLATCGMCGADVCSRCAGEYSVDSAGPEPATYFVHALCRECSE